MTTVAAHQTEDALPRARLGPGRVAVYLLFAWAVALVCAFSTTLTAVCFFDIRPQSGFSFRIALIGTILAALRYGAGAFVLGSLTRDLIKSWPITFVYIIPFFLLHGLVFLASAVHEPIKDEALANPGTMIVMPIVYLLLCPFVSFWFLRIGANTGANFHEENSALGIPWYHWLWIVPFGLTQVIGVPLYLLLLLWKIDLLAEEVYPSMLNLPALIPRIIVLFILVGAVMLIALAHDALSDRSGPIGVRIIKVVAAWLGLSIMQVLIVLSAIGKYMD